MGGLTAQQESWLRERFHNRVSTDLMERKIYSHDVGEMPPLVKPLIGKALADAVVQPKNEEEIVELVRWAVQNRIPLVPRGKATSGYGGVLPVKGGITVDFWRMRSILAVDKENLTVTVEPGIVWEFLEKELAKQGLALRLYPSSAPSSTVGGWLAQGGFGYGSFEYGSFAENVVSARVVLPTGEVREFSGEDLALIAGAEGITGIITQITLRVRPLEKEVVVGARFSEVRWLAAALREVIEKGLPLWSVSFINPQMARLKNQRPPKMEHGHPVHDDHRPKLPEAYLAIFVFPASREDEVQGELERIIAKHGGERLLPEVAEHEWEERFKIMHIKRLGPSLIPTEVIIPLENLDAALEDLESSIHQPLVIEGMVAKGGQVILLGFIPHDSRRFAFNLAFALSLSAIQKAKKYGGRAYASGLYFAHEAKNILGADQVQRLREFKRKVDPKGIMNPGKILGNGLLGTFMSVAGAFEPLVRAVGNAAKAPIGERPQGAGKRDIPDDVAWYAYACAQCGYCVDECDEFYGRGWESYAPRSKWFFLREYMAGRAKFDQAWVDRFLACTTCETCNVECPLELPNEPSWLKMRGVLIHEQGHLTFPPFEIMRAALRKERNIWASYSKDRAKWVPEDIEKKIKWRAEIGYFPGCTASYVEQDVAQGTARLLDAAGIEFTYMGDGEACCGLPMLVAGLWDDFADILRHNVEGMKERGVKTVVTSCPACWLSWKVYYPEWAKKLGIEYDFEVKHYSELIAEKIKSGEMQFTHPVNMKVTWHDSCHMGRAGGIYDPPRELLKAIPGLELVEMEHIRDHAHCCGGVLTLLENPDTGKVIGDIRVREAEETGADALVASCPCCEVQFRVTMEKTNRDMPVIDLAHIAVEALGQKLPDPTDYALNLWATFEAMIWLMKPEAMAKLMEELFPQMVDAMPLGMGKMMRAIGKMPGGRIVLKAMKPMFPILFPILMPGMMDKVMPDMLVAVEKRVPMPQHMKEQMPDLMPMAMENLMPKMLPQLVPLISDPLIDYLSGRNGQAT
ncbi:MAG TPA: FAD-binding oxidoreductase [Chloroflexi bacterium]|nr:FAD-binding oxidoreductase [Chloroflexota bacterium]